MTTVFVQLNHYDVFRGNKRETLIWSVLWHNIRLKIATHVTMVLVATDDQPTVPSLHLAPSDANAQLS